MSAADAPADPAVKAGMDRLLAGGLWGLGAAAIWSGWWVVTRSSVTSSLGGPDLAALRFGVAGALMLVVLWRCRAQVAAVPPVLLLIMAAGSGAPYALVAGLGLKFASAGNGGALTLGMLPVFTAILSALLLGERIGHRRAVGIAVIAAGSLVILGPGVGATGAWPGHLLFVLGAAMWAGFTVAMRISGLGAITATAVVCVFSAIGYLPLYLALFGTAGLTAAPAGELAFQAVYQGGFSAIGALFCYCRAIQSLGTTRAAVFAALVPVLATGLGALVLGESPSATEVLGVAFLSLGIYVAARAMPPAPIRIPRSAPRIPTVAQSLASTPTHHLPPVAAQRGLLLKGG